MKTIQNRRQIPTPLHVGQLGVDLAVEEGPLFASQCCLQSLLDKGANYIQLA